MESVGARPNIEANCNWPSWVGLWDSLSQFFSRWRSSWYKLNMCPDSHLLLFSLMHPSHAWNSNYHHHLNLHTHLDFLACTLTLVSQWCIFQDHITEANYYHGTSCSCDSEWLFGAAGCRMDGPNSSLSGPFCGSNSGVLHDPICCYCHIVAFFFSDLFITATSAVLVVLVSKGCLYISWCWCFFLLQSGMHPWERKAAYACDITYSNNSVCGTYFLKNECNKSSLIIDSCRDRTHNKVLESFIINIIWLVWVELKSLLRHKLILSVLWKG